MLDNAIKDPSEISRKTRIPLLGTVGNNYYDSSIPVQDKPKSSFTESFRALRTNLDLLLGGEEKKAVLISSTISSEGKSLWPPIWLLVSQTWKKGCLIRVGPS